MKDLVKDEEQMQFTPSPSEAESRKLRNRTCTAGWKISGLLLTMSLVIFCVAHKSSFYNQSRIAVFPTQFSSNMQNQNEQLSINEVSSSKSGQIFHPKIQLITRQTDEQKVNQIFEETTTNHLQMKVGSQSSESKNIRTQQSKDRRQKGGSLKVRNQSISLVNMLKKNEQNQRFGQFAYSTQLQQQRQSFLKERIGFVANPEVHESLYLSMFNMEIDQSLLPYKEALFPIEYNKISRLYNLDKVEEQLPICVITPSFNNNHNFRIELNLNSIFSQNYSNYFVVIINDASQDASQLLFQKYLQFHSIPKDRYAFINNLQHKGALENIFTATKNYCSQDSIVMSIDGDDQLIGRNVFKIFNAEHQRLKAGVLYSNFYYYNQKEFKIVKGFTEQYPEVQKQNNLYRLAPMRFSQLRSFRKSLFNAILQSDLKDQTGRFYGLASDMALFFPLLELSCGKVFKIEGIHYLYNVNTGFNDYLRRDEQLQKDKEIRKKMPYSCQPHLLPK